MDKFKNKIEQDFWIGCIRHAERLKETKGTYIEVKYHKSEYIEYADKMLEQFREKQK